MDEPIKLPPRPHHRTTLLVRGFGGSEYRDAADDFEARYYSASQLEDYARAAVMAERARCIAVCDGFAHDAEDKALIYYCGWRDALHKAEHAISKPALDEEDLT
jgi:hypothetical protein